MSAEALAATNVAGPARGLGVGHGRNGRGDSTTHLAKETNGAVLDAAPAVARVASPELAPALPMSCRRASNAAARPPQRRGLRAVVAFRRSPSETTDALVDGITTSKNARVGLLPARRL